MSSFVSVFAISPSLLLIGFKACYIMCFCRAFVFFSSPIAKELVLEIKKDTLVLPRIGALREVKFCFCFLNIYELYFRMNICRKQFHILLIVIFSFHCAWQMNLEYFAIDSQVCGMWLYFIYLAFYSYIFAHMNEITFFPFIS